jgi:uncharacterized damage-inducible protein DinB
MRPTDVLSAPFGSLNGTLNHLLTADRIWMHRLTGTGDHPAHLDAILFADLAQLQTAREAEDRRIIGYGPRCRGTRTAGSPPHAA